MDPHVRLQNTRRSKTFEADFTLVWLLTRMDDLVSLQIALSRERLVADVARVHRCCGSMDALTHWRLHTTLYSSFG